MKSVYKTSGTCSTYIALNVEDGILKDVTFQGGCNGNLQGISKLVKDMPVDEMKQFFHQTLVAMADTFQRATADEKMSDTMRDFCDYFAEKMDLKA